MHIRLCLKPNNFVFFVFAMLSTIATIAIAETNKDLIKAALVKDNHTLDILKEETRKVAPSNSDIEENQLVTINYDNHTNYIVPVRANGEENRGCYIYSFDQNIKMRQTIILSKLEELESCEIIKAVFSCNKADKTTSGVGVLYGKRLGSDHYFFEGTYLILNTAGTLSEDNKLSQRLNDIDTVSKAKKKLGCR